MAAWIWVLIPITAILAGTVKEWWEFKAKQNRLGLSTHELEETVGALRDALERSESERERLIERVENLETIVTSQAWDALHEPPAQETLGNETTAGRPDESSESKAETTERLARRMQV